MRSYYSHLETATGVKTPTAKPVYRSSAIFPAFQLPGFSTRLLFLGYWALKRNIPQIACVVTLRDTEGQVMIRENHIIDEPKAYQVELNELLTKCGISLNSQFTGSLEIEFFSTVNLVFPYPAVAVNYYGPSFSSVVHTAQRVYNDFDDMKNNSQTQVAESGFNIYADKDREPFLSLINGPITVPNSVMEMQFFNSKGEILRHNHTLGEMKPYQTEIVFPSRLIDLKTFLKGKPGAGKVRFHVSWIFPRLLVGNMQEIPPAVSITHTYYDCSTAKSDSDYWFTTPPEWHPAVLMVPVTIQENEFTNIYFYPIYSPASFAIDLEIYNGKGDLLGKKNDVVLINPDVDEVKKIDIESLCRELNIKPEKYLTGRILARTIGAGRLPARIKIGLDLGSKKLPHMPCNICTNLQPFNPKLETKPSTFRWFPVLADQPEATFWILNTTPAKDNQKSAEATLNFYRQKDTQTITRNAFIPPNGSVVVNVQEDPELVEFFEGQVGWCTLSATNPYVTSFYFAKNPSGVIGGDHGF